MNYLTPRKLGNLKLDQPYITYIKNTDNIVSRTYKKTFTNATGCINKVSMTKFKK